MRWHKHNIGGLAAAIFRRQSAIVPHVVKAAAAHLVCSHLSISCISCIGGSYECFSLFVVYLFAPRAVSCHAMPCHSIPGDVLPVLRIFCSPKQHTCNCVSWLHLRVPTATATVIATIYFYDVQPPQMMFIFIYSCCCNLRVRPSCPCATLRLLILPILFS